MGNPSIVRISTLKTINFTEPFYDTGGKIELSPDNVGVILFFEVLLA